MFLPLLPRNDTNMLLRAIAFSAEKHKKQRRKDAEQTPYINHPISVMRILNDDGHVDDLITLTGAILHDVIEDTQTTTEELDYYFGVEIRDLVLEVTTDQTLPKNQQKRSQIENAHFLSFRAKLIKVADKTSNILDIIHSPPANWTQSAKLGYLESAKALVDRVRGVNAGLEAAFDEAHTEALQVISGESPVFPLQ